MISTPPPRVQQLFFARHEFARGLRGVSATEANHRFGSMNSLGWIVGHMAWHEQLYWLQRAQGQTLVESVLACGFGQPASTPNVDEMWTAWDTITAACDAYLNQLSPADLLTHLMMNGSPRPDNLGTDLQRVTYHYWFHLGEGLAIRQMLGHTGLPEFVGDINRLAPYTPESPA